MMVRLCVVIGIICLSALASESRGHADSNSNARYLGNAAVLVRSGDATVLFDPFFHNDFNRYTLVPETTRQRMFAGKEPYSSINAVFINHAHSDHFDAADLARYLKAFPNIQLFAPAQAVMELSKMAPKLAASQRVHPIALQLGQEAWRYSSGSLQVEAVRIPHAGWPQRADVENLVFRISLNDTDTVMHLGDADPSDGHFSPHRAFWEAQRTDLAMPPFWFMLSEEGRQILEQRLNSEHAVGVHMDNKLDPAIFEGRGDFFRVPGETRKLKP